MSRSFEPAGSGDRVYAGPRVRVRKEGRPKLPSSLLYELSEAGMHQEARETRDGPMTRVSVSRRKAEW